MNKPIRLSFPVQQVVRVGKDYQYGEVNIAVDLKPIHVAALVVELIKTHAFLNDEVLDILGKIVDVEATKNEAYTEARAVQNDSGSTSSNVESN